MKKQYEKPSMSMDMFEANEYIAACWKINCNVPSGYGYKDNNGNGQYDSGDTLLTPRGYHGKPSTVWGCGTWHKGVQGVPDDGPKANAMWHSNENNSDYPVYYWGSYGTNAHFSKVDDAQWETNPNAS